jgi:hypothetical protein
MCRARRSEAWQLFETGESMARSSTATPSHGAAAIYRLTAALYHISAAAVSASTVSAAECTRWPKQSRQSRLRHQKISQVPGSRRNPVPGATAQWHSSTVASH